MQVLIPWFSHTSVRTIASFHILGYHRDKRHSEGIVYLQCTVRGKNTKTMEFDITLILIWILCSRVTGILRNEMKAYNRQEAFHKTNGKWWDLDLLESREEKKERNQVVKCHHIFRDRRILWDCYTDYTETILLEKILKANTWWWLLMLFTVKQLILLRIIFQVDLHDKIYIVQKTGNSLKFIILSQR